MTRGATPIWVVPICLAVGLAMGFAYAGDYSNHATYVPPGLRLWDPTFLSHDWWATANVHYHWAYSILVAALAALGIVPWGLAIGNVVAVAATLWVIWRIVGTLAPHAPALVFGLFVCVFLATDTMLSAGSSYIFTESLQPSSIAAFATVLALCLASRDRYGAAGVVLAAGGAFHANFLVLNIAFFGLAFAVQAAFDARRVVATWRGPLWNLTKLVAPSLAVAALVLPLIVSIADSPSDEQTRRLASTIFFEIRAPHHYNPRSDLIQFLPLAGWQILGLAWTRVCVPDALQRRFWWALQIAFAVLLWSATALTTIVFVEQVSRLFVWRLAPFSELVAVALFIGGAIRLLVSDETPAKSSWILVGASAVACALIARELQNIYGVLSARSLCVLAVPAGLTALVALRLLQPMRWLQSAGARAVSAVLVVALAAASIVSTYLPGRHNLIVMPAEQALERELFDWVRASAAPDAVFAVPPDRLWTFRLLAGRAIIVDWKNVPFNADAMIEWYRRLERVSGPSMPRSMAEAAAGYARLDKSRLEALHAQYGIDYAVITASMDRTIDGWPIAFANKSYIVLMRAGTRSNFDATGARP